MTDRELLAEYRRTGSGDLFGEIVARHMDMVYSSCLRVLGEAHAAEDAAQATFLLLMHKAKKLGGKTVLAGWLFRTAKFTALRQKRSAFRRSRHEREAAMEKEQATGRDSTAGWELVSPELDAAMAALTAHQQNVVVMRLMQQRTQADVARELGCAQSSVSAVLSRSLDKLRGRLAKMGIGLSAAALGAMLAENSVTAAPAGLVASVQAICAGRAVASNSATKLTEGVSRAMFMTKLKTAAMIVAAVATLGAGGAVGAQLLANRLPPASRVTGPKDKVLDNRTMWRVRVVRETEEVQLPSGEVGHYRLSLPRGTFKKLSKKEYTLPVGEVKAGKVKMRRIPAETSPDWFKPEFDDSEWLRTSAPMQHQQRSPAWKLLLVRGQFRVVNPSDLKLSLTYKGGVVVYLNGEELTRKDMLKGGKNGMYASAAPDAKQAYLGTKGLHHVQHLSRQKKEVVAARTRTLSDFAIPATRLRKGVNTLAIAVHRSVAPWQLYASCENRRLSAYDARTYSTWTRAALHQVCLAGPGAVANHGASADHKLVLRAASVVRKAYAGDYVDPYEAARPVRIYAVRGGIFCGQAVAGGAGQITGLSASASDLAGPGKIPASAVELLYAVPDGPKARKVPDSRIPFDSLMAKPPATVKSLQGCSSALQPIWIRVCVPADAKPGLYRGKLSVNANGTTASVPVELDVSDWKLPARSSFVAYTDMFQSSETLAMAYNVPMWSEKHWKLIERSFELMGEMASKSVYLTAVRRSHLGNEHAMIRFKRGAGGKLEPDLSITKKYLDLTVKHLGRIPTVVLYGWEPPDSMGHGNTFSPPPEKIHDREILVTVVGKGGALLKEKGPKWGSPECVAFWKRLIDALQKELDARKIPDSMLMGLMGDHRPSKAAVETVRKAAPKLQWAIHAHHYCDKWQGQEVGLCASVWGIKCITVDPDKGHGYGWQNLFRLVKYPRGDLSARSSLTNYRTVEEKWIGAKIWNAKQWPKAKGARGLGRQGADFWPVVKDKRGRLSRLAARYPETYWGQLCINYGNPAFFGKGPDGAVRTCRSEMIRENVQEIEARVFIEKALLDPARKARLGADLAGRCRTALDERIRMCLYGNGDGMAWYLSTGVGPRMKKLFGLAAEVSKKLGK